MLKKIALGLLMVAALALPSHAQTAWPPKNVRIIAPFGPGSTPDIVARMIAEQLGKQYPDSTFVVENKAGASGNTGTDVVAKATPDGTTIGISIGGPLAINTLLFSKLPYDPKKDIAAVTQLITQPSVLAVSNDLGVNSVKDLIALIKASPGKYNFSSIGNGSLSHLAMEAVAIKAGTNVVHIPYKSSPEAVLDRHPQRCANGLPAGDLGRCRKPAKARSRRSPCRPPNARPTFPTCRR